MGIQLEVAKVRIVVLEKILESPLDSKELKQVNPKGNQPWIFSGRTVAEAEAPILWSADVTSRLIEKDLNAGEIEGRRKRGQQRMRRLVGITNSVVMNLSKLQEGCKESDMTEQLNNNRSSRK